MQRLRPLIAVLACVLGLLLLGACVSTGLYQSEPTPSPARTPARQGTDTPVPPSVDSDPYAESRRRMVEGQISARGVDDERVLGVLQSVPRHKFVLEEYRSRAYEDRPLPIGYGQTISQPYIVAVMTQLLQVDESSEVLEIGTGSGYQAAVLARLADQVYTMEIVEPLCEQARERLARLGFDNVTVRCADGYNGWAEHAPYDAIIVTAAPDHIPQPLVNQLADGGRMIIPVGPPGAYQTLWLLERDGQEVSSERIMGVVFVPLTRKRDR